jgi:hypothetical protein
MSNCSQSHWEMSLSQTSCPATKQALSGHAKDQSYPFNFDSFKKELAGTVRLLSLARKRRKFQSCASPSSHSFIKKALCSPAEGLRSTEARRELPAQHEGKKPMNLKSKIIQGIAGILTSLMLLSGWQTHSAIYVGDIVQNGDFKDWETGVGPAHWTWTERIDFMGYAVVFGTVSQDLETIPGQAYRVHFSMAGHPSTDVAALNIYWAGNLIGATTWSPNGVGPESFHWIEGSFLVAATETQSLLTFESGNVWPTMRIPFLADVSVTPVPEPSSTMFVVVATGMLIGWNRRRHR